MDPITEWMLQGKKIILGISGGIAAYKSALLIRLFKKAGAEVRVVATQNALEFITRVTLESLSENKIYDTLFDDQNDYTTEHVSLTDWGDVFVLAPATANIIGKLAGGIADDALSTSLLAFDKKLIIAPAMNCKMYDHFAVQKNINYLSQNGVIIIEPAEGFLACGYEGRGRMEEPEVIVQVVESSFLPNKKKLKGKTLLITAGPTQEPIDPVRYIGNRSSGKMGYALAEELARRGALINLVSGPVNISINNPGVKVIHVQNAEQMHDESMKLFHHCDAAIMAAAVADFRPEQTSAQKIKKSKPEEHMNVKLVPTIDILEKMGVAKTQQVLVGFALETDNEIANAKKKLQNKNLDFIVLNSLSDAGAGFEHNTNKITIINNKQEVSRYPLKDKKEVAADIADMLENYLVR